MAKLFSKIASTVVATFMLTSQAMAEDKPLSINVPEIYTDIAGHEYELCLRNAVHNGILHGSGDKLYPDSSMTRAQLASTLVRVFGYKEKADLSGFSDIPRNSWYYEDLSKAVAAGVINGKGEEMFPNNAVSRQEACLMLCRVFNLDYVDGDFSGYKDWSAVAGWAKPAVGTMLKMGALNADRNIIRPEWFCSRAEFASMLYHIVQAYDNDLVNSIGTTNGSCVVSNYSGPYSGLNIYGDMYIVDGVGDADVGLKRSSIGGSIFLHSGDIDLEDGTCVEKVVVSDCKDKTFIHTDPSSEIKNIVVKENTGDIVIEARCGVLTVLDENVHIKIQNSVIQRIENPGNVMLDINVDDNSVIEEFYTDTGVKNMDNTPYSGAVVVPCTNSYFSNLVVTKYDPIKFMGSYNREITDLVENISFESDLYRNEIWINGDFYKAGYSDYWVPLKLIVSGITHPCRVYVDGVQYGYMNDMSNDTYRLNVLVPFTHQDRVHTITVSSDVPSQNDLNIRVEFGSNARLH